MKDISKSKRIAKNTILLYIRMFISMIVSLYTSRVILNALGVLDFGLYNVVGGVVFMFSFLNIAMSVGIQRFFSYELGLKTSNITHLFASSINVQILISIIVLFLAETIGFWFLNTKVVIPDDRLIAANWVYQSTIFSFVLIVITVPYTAFLLSKEKMDVYAFISILDTILKLVIVIYITRFNGDKLITYAILLFLVEVIIASIYFTYCSIKYDECKYTFCWNSSLINKLIKYSGWNLFGGVAAVCNNYGINLILNLFFGPTVNAARGIAYQVNTAVTNFTTNFQTALNPQIVKSYASGDYSFMESLIYKGAKYSFFLLLFITLPLLINMPFVLKIWLKIVPEYSVIFTRLVILNSLIDCLSGTLMIASQASGNIKIYQSVVGSLSLMNLPFAYLLIYMYDNPVAAFVSSIFIAIIALFIRLLIVSRLVPISIMKFIKEVLSYVIVWGTISIVIPIFIKNNMADDIYSFCFSSIICWCWITMIFAIFCTKVEEKKFIINIIKSKL